jgi:thioredoxin reductase (NADPH)
VATNQNYYTLIIVGGGPIGLACALEARKHAVDYLIIEKGCLVNSLYNYPVNMTFFSTSERLEIGGIPFVSNNAKPTRPEALEYYRRVASSGNVQIRLFEKVMDVTKKENPPGGFSVVTSKQTYNSQFVIIATGFYDIPYLLNVPGEELPKVSHYYKDPHFYAFQKVIVIGANNSAVDAALETWRKGAEVTMVIRESKIGDRVKYWVKPDIENRIKEGSIKAYFNSTVTEIKENEVEILTPDGPLSLANKWVLAMTGYQPDLVFLERIGIDLGDDDQRKPVHDDSSYETNIPGIFIAGVICGGMNTHRLFIENSREHAEKIVAVIARRHIKPA